MTASGRIEYEATCNTVDNMMHGVHYIMNHGVGRRRAHKQSMEFDRWPTLMQGHATNDWLDIASGR